MKTTNWVLMSALLLLAGSNIWAIQAGFNIQGRLTDANGDNKNGTFQIKFSVFDAANTLAWEKTMPDILVQNGNFQVDLKGPGDSSVQSIELENAVKNIQDAYLEIKVGGDPPLVPRQRLLRSPFYAPSVPVGTIITYAAVTRPEGWLYCNGQAFNKTAYPELFGIIGCSFGCPDSSTFNVPDLRGEFVRGYDAGRGVDNGRVLGNAQAAGTNTLAWVQMNNQGPYASPGGTTVPLDGTLSGMVYSGSSAGGVNWHLQFQLSGAETRPRNIALTYLIKH